MRIFLLFFPVGQSCKHRFTIHASTEQRNSFPKILKCPSIRDQPCNSKGFKTLEGSGRCRDYQEIKIQENVGKLGVGSIPRSLVVVLMDDLADQCKAGDDITISGIVKRRWKYAFDGEKCDVELFFEANCIRVRNEQRFGLQLTDELISDFHMFWEKYKDHPLQGNINTSL